MSDRIAIFGSRNWINRRLVSIVLFELAEAFPDIVLVHGACESGVDYFADVAARTLGIPIDPAPALWYPDPNGPIDYSAGPRRNRFMARSKLRYAVGFRSDGKSNGTDNMRKECRDAGVLGWFFHEGDDLTGGVRL